MRALLFATLAALFVSACSDLPTDPLREAPTVQFSHVGSDIGDSTADDLCGGLSPCDAFDYDRDGDGSPDGVTGVPGFCYLPPMVDNHLSDPACSDPFVPGLGGVFQLAWCQVEYPLNDDGSLDGSSPPTIVEDGCLPEEEWRDLVRDPDGGEFYVTSVHFKRKDADAGDVFRLYLVRGGQHFAHRDVIVDPNLTTPADDFVHAIGHGTEPYKVRITEGFECVFIDTQEPDTNNAATCLVAGESVFTFPETNHTTTFNFPDGNPTFLADFEVSECLSLGFDFDGGGPGGFVSNTLVDVPLADCMISLSSEELAILDNPGTIQISVKDARWDSDSNGPFEDARLNVLQVDEEGVAALPPSMDPGWFGEATSDVALLRWLDRGLKKLASLFGARPLYATDGAGWDFTRMSDFQVSVQPLVNHLPGLGACEVDEPHCRFLGTFPEGGTVPFTVRVTAPSRTGGSDFEVPDARVHFFPQQGTVSCPAGSEPDADGRGCYDGIPDQTTGTGTGDAVTWDHVVYVTPPTGEATVDWTLEGGTNQIFASVCAGARPGDNEPDPPGEPGDDGVWGSLSDCSDRVAALTEAGAFDNGPADGFTPFEPVDTENEVAVYGLPLLGEAKTCPQITVDGIKDDAFGTPEWEACADKTGFQVKLKGPKPDGDNAFLYTWNDDDTLYMALEVETNELGNKIFIQLAENFDESLGDFFEAAGDELLVDNFDDPSDPVDWHVTQACVDNNSSSLCGDQDSEGDAGFDASAAAQEDGAGDGRVFYEFSRPFESPNRLTTAPGGKEDLDAFVASGELKEKLGLLLTVTQGQGGGKGGFVLPDPQTSDVVFHPFALQ